MTTAAIRRREVLNRIRDVVGDRLYDNMDRGRSVRVEVAKLLADGLIERCDRDGEPGYRRTAAGNAALEAS